MAGEYIAVGGGVAGLLAFALAVIKVYSSDKTWKSLIVEIRVELKECRDGRKEDLAVWSGEKAELGAKVTSLEGEVMSLRRELHTDRWLGIDAASRPDPKREHGDGWTERREHLFDQEREGQ